MNAIALNSLVALLPAAHVVMPAAKPAAPDPGLKNSAVENIIHDAAGIEKSDGCEAAYLKYKEAGDKLSLLKDRNRANQLQGVVVGKMDKLEKGFSSCQ